MTVELTTAEFTALATPPGPPRALRPQSQAMIEAIRPNKTDFNSATARSRVTANEAKVLM